MAVDHGLLDRTRFLCRRTVRVHLPLRSSIKHENDASPVRRNSESFASPFIDGGGGHLRQNLGEIFRFRDLAIDASSKNGTPVLHPELHVGGEWRFAYFRCENTALIVRATLQLIRGFVGSDKPKDADVQKYLDGLKPRLERLLYSNALRTQATAARI
jgi:hypothetical protein